MQKQRLILSVSVCLTLVLVGALVVVSKPFVRYKVRNDVRNDTQLSNGFMLQSAQLALDRRACPSMLHAMLHA